MELRLLDFFGRVRLKGYGEKNRRTNKEIRFNSGGIGESSKRCHIVGRVC